MMALELPEASLAGIVAFYAIVNISEESLPSVFREIHRVLQPGGLLLMAFHVGSEVIQKEELWGQTVSMDFFFFQTLSIRQK
jgi:ubiquinone/menaquinone biosynthesis C-methylase UbiE